jgi:glycosyltransferase involved in cell wall biosynthesis
MNPIPPAPIRVLAIDHTAGVSPFRRKFAAMAAHPGIELTVLAPDRWVEGFRTVRASPARSDGYRLDVCGVVWPGYENRAFFTGGLARAIRRARPDILHLWEEPFSFIALQSLLLRRALAPRAKALYFSSDNLGRDFQYPFRPSIVYATIERWVHRECEVGTAVSEEVVDVLREKGFRGPIDVVPHGLDLGAYREPSPERRAAARARMGARGVVIGYAGRLLPMKGVDVLLRAASGLASRFGLEAFTVAILGEGPDRERLRALAATLGLEERVRFLESVPHEAIPESLEAFDVMVVPSLTTPKWKEQFGRVAIEAMAAGSAIVVSSSGALPSVVGDAGVVTPEGDAQALADALSRLIASPEECRELGARGRARVGERYTWSAIASALVARYRAMLDASPGRAA